MIIDGRLINVSNRLPVSLRKYAGGYRLERSSGGLATALDSAWSRQPGIWIGWAGNSSGKQPAVDVLLSRASRRRPYTLQPVELSEEEVAKFYSGFANEIIWPLFHDMPSRCNFDPEYWETYQKVNRKYGQTIERTAKSEDFIWVHDYHLMLTAHSMREAGVKSRNGFFLHIPFPAPDVFEKLPWREAILCGLLDFDLVGFQTERDRNNFISCVQHLLPQVSIESGSPHIRARLQNRQATVGIFPISIDFEEFASQAARSDVAARCTEIRERLSGNLLVLGVDRMDYTKGIPERLKSFRILLRRFPELRGKITLVQVVVPSREEIPDYKDLRLDVELLVSQINGEFTQPGWVPIHYMHRNLSRHELLAYYRAADIALITPLKDGMNLVAKEFCAAQVDDRGVLVVSEFAGAASELRHGAILVNPNDFNEVAQALYTAAGMAPEEKRSRMQLLRQIVKEHNVQRWTRSFLQAAASTALTSTVSSSGSSSTSERIAAACPPTETPGVALVASAAPPPAILSSRLAWGHRFSRSVGIASGDD
jgi:alpha,alpha-trehalose-phosphate synthase [UDP-forming]